jgi:hypothetical protein
MVPKGYEFVMDYWSREEVEHFLFLGPNKKGCRVLGAALGLKSLAWPVPTWPRKFNKPHLNTFEFLNQVFWCAIKGVFGSFQMRLNESLASGTFSNGRHLAFTLFYTT